MKLPNVLIQGDSGSGKTYSLRTLAGVSAPTGITPFVLFTEPRFACLEDIPDSRLHWKYIAPATPGWASLKQSAIELNTLSNDLMQKREGVEREKYRQFIDVIVQMNNFKCDRCGGEFGDVTQWGSDKALIMDGLTGLAKMSMQLKVGSKPIKSQPDWGAAMDNLEMFLDMLTGAMQTMLVLIAHVEPQKDEVTGAIKNMAMSLGNKLSPKIPRNFDEVILTSREGSNFYWDNAASATVTKASLMPLSNKGTPDFLRLLSYYKPK
jgi:hypothetical protein